MPRLETVLSFRCIRGDVRNLLIRSCISCRFHGAVDQDVLRLWRLSTLCGNCGQPPSRCVEPITKSNCAKIGVIVGRSRAINKDCTNHTLAILRTVVAMVPIEAVRI